MFNECMKVNCNSNYKKNGMSNLMSNKNLLSMKNKINLIEGSEVGQESRRQFHTDDQLGQGSHSSHDRCL